MNEQTDTLRILKENFNNKILLTKKEVGATLGVSQSSVNNYINSHRNPLRCVKLGATMKSAIRVKLEDLAFFIDNLNTVVKEKNNVSW